MTCPTSSEASIQIGWASEDFTPPGPAVMRGQFHARVSESVDDPVTLTAMAIETTADGSPPQQAIIISCDLVHVAGQTQADVRSALKDRLPGFDLNMLLMHATHTHSAPTLEEGVYPPEDPPVMTPTQCVAIFVEKAAAAAEKAWHGRKASGISSAYSHAVVGHNRRPAYFDGSTVMYGQANDQNFSAFEGYEDHGLNLLFTWDANNTLTGIVVNVACPAQVSEHSKSMTADYWYDTRLELRKRFGGGIFVLPQCSAAGDQSPHHIIQKELEAEMERRQGFTRRQEIAQRIATGVDHVYETTKAEIKTEFIFRHEVELLALPVRMVTDQEYQLAQKNCAQLQADREMEDSQRHNIMKRNKKVIERYETQDDNPHKPIELHVLRLGDVAIATNPFELFLDFGIRIKARSKAMHTFLIQLACGSEGYLPTQKAVDGRGYGAEIMSNPVGPEGGQVLVNRTLEIIDTFWS